MLSEKNVPTLKIQKNRKVKYFELFFYFKHLQGVLKKAYKTQKHWQVPVIEVFIALKYCWGYSWCLVINHWGLFFYSNFWDFGILIFFFIFKNPWGVLKNLGKAHKHLQVTVIEFVIALKECWGHPSGWQST